MTASILLSSPSEPMSNTTILTVAATSSVAPATHIAREHQRCPRNVNAAPLTAHNNEIRSRYLHRIDKESNDRLPGDPSKRSKISFQPEDRAKAPSAGNDPRRPRANSLPSGRTRRQTRPQRRQSSSTMAGGVRPMSTVVEKNSRPANATAKICATVSAQSAARVCAAQRQCQQQQRSTRADAGGGVEPVADQRAECLLAPNSGFERCEHDAGDRSGPVLLRRRSALPCRATRVRRWRRTTTPTPTPSGTMSLSPTRRENDRER